MIAQHQENYDEYEEYSLVSCHSNKLLDLSQGGAHKGSLIIWEKNLNDNQSFVFYSCENGQHEIQCRQNGHYLTVENNHNGAKVTTAPKKNQPNQKFKIKEKEAGKGQYVVYTFCGKVLDCSGAGKNNGTQVIQWDYNGNKNQLWRFQCVNGEKFQCQLQSCHSDKMLDLSQGGAHKGSLIIWSANKGPNQTFVFVPTDSGRFHIMCKQNRQYLTVKDKANGSAFVTAKKTNDGNQKMVVANIEGEKDVISIRTCHAKAFDVNGASKNDGAQVIHYDYSGAKNQLWKKVNVKKLPLPFSLSK